MSAFLYFAYGSNLLLQRLLLEGYTSISFNCVARLDDFSLNFGYHSNRWKGAVATIIPTPGDHVWGVVWTMNNFEQPILDAQEGVDNGIYEPFEVTVQDASNSSMKCRSYRLLKEEPGDARPSFHYLDVIIRGAVQSRLPENYVEKLRQIEHNGYDRPLEIVENLNKMNNL